MTFRHDDVFIEQGIHFSRHLKTTRVVPLLPDVADMAEAAGSHVNIFKNLEDNLRLVVQQVKGMFYRLTDMLLSIQENESLEEAKRKEKAA